MANKKEPLSVNLSKLILTVSFIVSLGALFGAVGYLVSQQGIIPFINPPAIYFYSCVEDSDCISIKGDCCGCTGGGIATAINKNFKNQWNNYNCGGKMMKCLAVMSNDSSCINKEPQCVDNRCVLKEKTAQNQDVSITTDKTEYEQGETIKFRIDNTIQICTNDLPFSIIKLDGEYVRLQHSCMGLVGSGFDQYCENGKIVSEPIHQICEFPGRWCNGCSDALTCLDKSIHEIFTWDQKEYIETSEKCEGKTIHREVKKQVPWGKYQIIVGEKVIKEFTIK